MAADWFLDLGRQVCPLTRKQPSDRANIEANCVLVASICVFVAS